MSRGFGNIQKRLTNDPQLIKLQIKTRQEHHHHGHGHSHRHDNETEVLPVILAPTPDHLSSKGRREEAFAVGWQTSVRYEAKTPRVDFEVSRERMMRNLSKEDASRKDATEDESVLYSRLNMAAQGLTYVPTLSNKQAHARFFWVYDNRLADVPYVVASMPQLETLMLANNMITELSPYVGSMTLLRVLDLDHNKLTSIPHHIGALTSLTKLDLSYNRIERVSDEIGKLTRLTRLCMASNQLAELPASLANLTSLTILKLASNKLSYLGFDLWPMRKLELLSLSRNTLLDLDPRIGEVTSLTILSIDFNRIELFPWSIGLLTNLKRLSISQNDGNPTPTQIITAPLKVVLDYLRRFEYLVKFRSLNVGNLDLATFVFPSGPTFVSWKAITNLVLDNNRIGALPLNLYELAFLLFLSAESNRLVTLPPMLNRLKFLQTLNLARNQMRALPPDIGEIRPLREVLLEHNGFAQIPSCLFGLTNLTELRLDYNVITSVPDAISSLRNISLLSLSGNPLANISDSIVKLHLLRTLGLNGCQIPRFPKSFGSLRPSSEPWPRDPFKAKAERVRDKLLLRVPLRSSLRGIKGQSDYYETLATLHGWSRVRFVLFGLAGPTIQDKRNMRVFSSPYLIKAVERAKKDRRVDAQYAADDEEVAKITKAAVVSLEERIRQQRKEKLEKVAAEALMTEYDRMAGMNFLQRLQYKLLRRVLVSPEEQERRKAERYRIKKEEAERKALEEEAKRFAAIEKMNAKLLGIGNVDELLEEEEDEGEFTQEERRGKRKEIRRDMARIDLPFDDVQRRDGDDVSDEEEAENAAASKTAKKKEDKELDSDEEYEIYTNEKKAAVLEVLNFGFEIEKREFYGRAKKKKLKSSKDSKLKTILAKALNVDIFSEDFEQQAGLDVDDLGPYYRGLTLLEMQHNSMITLPHNIGNMTGLVSLKLGYNKIEFIPMSLGQCGELKELDLNFNNLPSIPDTLWKLRSLTSLQISANRLRELPMTLHKLENLQNLNISHNQIQVMPEVIYRLKKLVSLNASCNPMVHVDDDIGNLRLLQDLVLNGTKINRLPDGVCFLYDLRSLYVQGTRIERLPDKMYRLQRLQLLCVSEAQLDSDYILVLKRMVPAKKIVFC